MKRRYCCTSPGLAEYLSHIDDAYVQRVEANPLLKFNALAKATVLDKTAVVFSIARGKSGTTATVKRKHTEFETIDTH